MQTERVLLRPIITERATRLHERLNQVMFEVELVASKTQIRAAVESIYGVKVTSVRTMTVPGKLKRRGFQIGKRPNWKKAVVSLKKGDNIDFFAVE